MTTAKETISTTFLRPGASIVVIRGKLAGRCGVAQRGVTIIDAKGVNRWWEVRLNSGRGNRNIREENLRVTR